MEKSVKSRCRGPNFTKGEQLLLFRVIEPYSTLIECKKTDSIKQADKQNAWAKVAEIFNANTKGVPRSIDNLISCYRNAKSKIKKQHSGAKMLLEDTSKKEDFLNALEENGKNWDAISTTMQIPVEVCQSSFNELEKEIKKDDNKNKKNILGTGGGPPPSNNDDPFLRVKKFIDPQIDGLFTIYDGDANIMDQFQKSKPYEEQIEPIEISYLQPLKGSKEHKNPLATINIESVENMEYGALSSISNSNESKTPLRKNESSSRTELLRKKRAPELENESVENMEYGALSSISNNNGSKTPLRKNESCSRTELLRKKRAPELENDCSGIQSSSKQKKTVNESFLTLSEEKLKLVQLQKEILKKDADHKTKISELELEDKIKENKFKEEMRRKDTDHKTKISELELEDKIKENKFKEEMRQKELFLMDLKIKKEQSFLSK